MCLGLGLEVYCLGLGLGLGIYCLGHNTDILEKREAQLGLYRLETERQQCISVNFGANRKGVCDFLLVVNSNFGPVSTVSEMSTY